MYVEEGEGAHVCYLFLRIHFCVLIFSPRAGSRWHNIFIAAGEEGTKNKVRFVACITYLHTLYIQGTDDMVDP